jgi:ParB family chromosome partitioning protein
MVMSDVKKEKPRHLGRGLQALLNPTVLENMANKIASGSPKTDVTAVDVSQTSLSQQPAGGQKSPVLGGSGQEKANAQTSPASPIMDKAGISAVISGLDKIKISSDPGTPKLPPDKELSESLARIAISDIKANPYQPRTEWDQAQLQELADSIKANGIVQPVIVRRVITGYELVAGERRFRAAQMVGLDSVPAIVRQASDSQMLELALIENIHRADLNPLERAKAYQRYVQMFGLTQVEAAQRLGEDRSVVSNYLRLLDLPEDVRKMLSAGQISMGHARAILGLPTDELRRKLANRALAGRLSVREVERLVKKYCAEPTEPKANISIKAPNIIDLENKLRRELGTKVIIDTKKNGQRGKITIEFYSLDEFERITQKMGIESLEEV